MLDKWDQFGYTSSFTVSELDILIQHLDSTIAKVKKGIGDYLAYNNKQKNFIFRIGKKYYYSHNEELFNHPICYTMGVKEYNFFLKDLQRKIQLPKFLGRKKEIMFSKVILTMAELKL